MPYLRSLAFLALISLLILPPRPLWASQMLRRAPDKIYAEAFEDIDDHQYETAKLAIARGSDPTLNKVLMAYLMAAPGNDYSFEDMAGFIITHPDWPGLNNILMIAEQKIPALLPPNQVTNWFNAYPPVTDIGFYRYMDALDALGQTELSAKLIRNRWINKNFCAEDSKAFKARYAPVLRQKDHVLRLDRLLWDNHVGAARAMYPYVGSGAKALAEARIALANDKSTANKLINKIPKTLQNDEGLLFERLKWRRKKGMDSGALDILLSAPKKLRQAERWWKERHIIIRRVIEQKKFALAYKLVATHSLSDGFDYAQAEFLAGWLALRFLNQPLVAEKHFKNLIEKTNTPVSQARGYYWMGRAQEILRHRHEAEQSYQSAAAINTTFYGQMATTRLYAAPTIFASAEPPVPAHIRSSFYTKDIILAIEKLNEIHEYKRAALFFKAAVKAASQRVEFALLLELAYMIQQPHWAVITAKAANQKNFILRGEAYPVLAFNIPSPPDVALTHALIRQESEFRADAGSNVGAQGLMQLMPATAKSVAKSLGLDWQQSKMTNPSYNILLGTTFIQRQIDNFNGSYILALAGYNAGPRRVREWIDLYGDPRKGEIDPIDWIELIPMYETRNYVQRIIENLQFYRARLQQDTVPLSILEDIKR